MAEIIIPKKTIGDEEISSEALGYIPEDAAKHYRFVPISIKDGVLEVGLVDPENIESRDALNFISTKVGLPFKIYSISIDDFEKALTSYKRLTEEIGKALSQIDKGVMVGVSFDGEPDRGVSEVVDSENTKKVETKIVEDAPITKIVATILRYATEGNASDVHIENMRENIRVRFRVDGVLNTSLVLPTKVHSAVVARIKILSSMRLDEKRKPQDGRFTAKIEGRKVDFRVSTFPTFFGEKIVMRILDQDRGIRKLDDLGLSKKNIDIIRQSIKKPYGLILISGPTGSGKSTTLYAMLNEFDRETENVLSLEDPVEYNVEGVNQSQVRPEIGYDFATGLRTTLRQDPDVIMVGEIRDKETAALAIQAALTGHIVLATIHTNNAAGVIPRLIDMGVDPFLIAPTLILAMAQRLVSTLCPNAGTPVPVEGSIRMMIEKEFEDLPAKYRAEIPIGKELYRISGTQDCPTGLRGRMAVMELLQMSPELENVILKNPVEPEIMRVARAQGMLTMKEDAMLKAFNRQIPFEEIGNL